MLPADFRSIAFIGTGQMATALACGFSTSLLSRSAIRGYDPSADARQQFVQNTGEGVQVSNQMTEAVADASVVILAVKPQVMLTALRQLAPLITVSQLVVSVAAGYSLERLGQELPSGTRLIRVMPNTPCLIGLGASGISAGSSATEADMQLVSTLLQTVGLVEAVPEQLLDAVTGLSGSGPAYVFQMIEALSDGGVKMGLPRPTATRLAAQTLLGSAQMVLQTGRHAAELKDSVTSPGGTTIAGLHAMESGGVRAALISAVETATRRAAELGRQSFQASSG